MISSSLRVVAMSLRLAFLFVNSINKPRYVASDGDQHGQENNVGPDSGPR